MGTIVKLGPRRYQAKVRRVGHSIKTRVCSNESEAKAWISEVEADIAGGRFAKDGLGKETLREIKFGKWLDRYAEEVAPNWKNADDMIRQCRRIRKYPIAEKTIAELKPKDFHDFGQALVSERGVSAQTLRHYLYRCSAVYDAAIKLWFFDSVDNPLKKVSIPGISAPRRHRFSADDWERMFEQLKKAPAKTYALVAEFALETCARISEILECDVNNVKGLDTEAPVLTFMETKSGAPRSVPLSGRAVEILKEAVKLPSVSRGSRKIDYAETRVFKLSYRAMHHVWQEARERAGLQHLWIHDTRKEGVSRLFDKGWDVVSVSAVSGHGSLDTLKRHYAIQFAEHLAKKMRA